ncbi:MAG: V-type ATP synthase subunit I [Candidatus Asgardarchaeia archaeon]
MLIPVKKLTIITLTDFEEELLWNLGKLGAIQLKKPNEEELLGFESTSSEESRRYEELLDRFNNLCKSLCPDDYEISRKESVFQEKESLIDIEKVISEYENKLAYITAELSRNEERIKSLKFMKEKLKFLRKYDVESQEISSLTHPFSTMGTMNKKHAEELKEKFARYSQIIFVRTFEYDESEAFVFITSLAELKSQIQKILTSYGFKELKIPPEIPPKVDEALKWIDDEIKKSEIEINKLSKQKELLRNEFMKNAYTIKSKLVASYRLSMAQEQLLRSKFMIALQGWLPENKVNKVLKFLEDMKEHTGGKILYSIDEPSHDEKVPTVQKNPKMFKAHESLIRQYGSPGPHETDPTIIGGILWTIMFGLMFPEYGEGFIILILGIIFSHVLKGNTVMGVPAKKLGNLMIGMGISAMFFGLLIGEFFLIEVEPLWPGLPHGWLENPYYILWLIKIAIFFGIAEITIGMLINIQRNLKHGHKIEAILGEHGLAGLIGFFGIVILAFSFIGIRILPPLTLPTPILGISRLPAIDFPEADLNNLFNLQRNWSIFLSLILIAIAAGALLYKSIIEKEGIILGFSVIYETILSFITNMLSFVRIAGFAIAHAALAMVVMKLLEYDLILGVGMGLIFLNAFALALELMVVIIQATRLLFYEFLTKFYEGSGEMFKPFKL